MPLLISILRIAATILLGIIALFIAAWFVGRVASDRRMWSQWLAWIPTLAALIACAMALALSTIYPVRSPAVRRRRVLIWSIVTLLVAIHFTFVEHRFWRSEPEARGLKLVHWNPSLRTGASQEGLVEQVIRLDGDLTILTNATITSSNPEVGAWLGPGRRPLWRRPFLILSKVPIRELQWLVRTKDVAVVELVLEAPEHFQRPVRIYLVDLPSNTDQSRMETALAVREMLRDADVAAPDLLVGDLNITRGSASLEAVMPDLRHAYGEGGHGYGATFPRGTPLYHIDHVLLSEDVRCTRYDIIDPGLGFHRAQVVWVEGR